MVATLAEWTGYIVWGVAAFCGLLVAFSLVFEWAINSLRIKRDMLEVAQRMYRERRAKRGEERIPGG